jgi:adenylate kinase
LSSKLLVFFGAPGVGKGTQAKIISSKLHIPHISTGDILRNAIAKKTKLGLKAKIIMDKGELVPDDIMIKLVKNVLKTDNCKDGFILDGFPRTINQAEMLQPIVDDLFNQKLIIIAIDAQDQVIIDRLGQRRMCSMCNNIVNLNFLKESNTCPTCGSQNSFIKRKDDEVEVIKNRLEVFHKTTKPVLEFYISHAINYHIDGTMSVEDITESICKKIEC